MEAYHPKHFLFYSQCHQSTQLTGITTRGVNWAIKEAKSIIKSKKKITAHTLRHSYATHLLEQGVHILNIQKLLGHAHIETTMVYLHVAQIPHQVVANPLDVLYPTYSAK